MSLRSLRERATHTIAFKLGGILIATPPCALVFSALVEGSLAVIAALSAAVMLWSPLHNIVFDWLDLRLTGPVASDRPHGLRLEHAASHEATALIATLPLLMWMGGHSCWRHWSWTWA